MPLRPQHEEFCRAYAADPNGAAAARAAGYSEASARNQALRLLARADIAARLAELGADIGSRREAQADLMIAQLDPIYRASLRAGRYDRVMQIVELQARIAGLLRGGSTIPAHPDGPLEGRIREMVALAQHRTANPHQYGDTPPLDAARIERLSSFDLDRLDAEEADEAGIGPIPARRLRHGSADDDNDDT